jgi:hypothetical protein
MKTLGLLAAGVLLVACADSSPVASSQDSDFTTARSAPDADVPAYTSADAPPAYGARVRVSFAGRPVSEAEQTSAYGGTLSPSLPRPWSLGVGRSPANRAVFVYFGQVGAKQLATGTYSCADGDAMIFEAEWNADGTAKPPHDAQTCSLVVDSIGPGPSKDYVQVYGHFQASAAAPDGLSTDVKGTFVGDFYQAP